jgi:hypothetical protein
LGHTVGLLISLILRFLFKAQLNFFLADGN